MHARLQTQGLSCARNLVHEALAFRTRILLSGRLYFSRTCSILTCMMRRAFLTVAFWTSVSRALGFVRDLLMATFLGTGLVAEAFMVAFRFPNLFRHVFAEGAFSAAFTPMFTRRLQTQGLPCARKLAQEALAFLSWTLILCCLVAILAMPFLISLLAPGFDGEKKALATALGRITFPYLWAMGVVALLTGVLNGLYRFAAGAAAPILLNVCWIGALLLILPYIPNAYAGSRVLPNTGYLLAWTIAFSGLAQVLLLYVASRRAGIRLHSLALPKWTPGIKLLLTRMGPNVLTAAVLQVNLLVGTIIASVQKGAIAWLYYADRLCQLPLGLIGVTLSVVLLPKVAKQLQAGQITNARHALESGIRVSVLLSLPAAAALMVMPDTIIRTLFARGAFDEASTLATSAALAVLAFGLPAYILCRTLQAVFFAAEDTRTPFRCASVSMVLNTICALTLFPVFGYIGIASAVVLASWVQVAGLWLSIGKTRIKPRFRALRRTLYGAFGATVLMTAVLYAMQLHLTESLYAGREVHRILALLALVGVGLLVYGGVMLLTETLCSHDRRAALGGMIRRYFSRDS